DIGLRVIVDGGILSQGCKHVEYRQGARSCLYSGSFGRDTPAQLLENSELAFENPFVGTENLLLVLLQRRRDEALTSSNRLLAMVIGRHRVQVRPRHLDVVPEDAIEPDLERADPRACAFAFLHLRDDLFARTADRLQIIELAIDSFSSEP